MKQVIYDSLVTGGTGFVGRWLVASLLRRQHRVVVVVRGGEDRAGTLRAFLRDHAVVDAHLRCIDGDLGSRQLDLPAIMEGLRDVYHLAAAFGFGLEVQRTREINVRGTERLIRWAAAQPSLRRFVHLGGYRVTVMPTWIRDAFYPLDAATEHRLYRSFGAYEASKYESHLAAQSLAAQLGVPISVVHPSSVIGSSLTGESSQVMGMGDIIEKLWHHKLPALAGSARTFVPVVCVDYLAEFMATVPERAETAGQQLCVLQQDSPRLPQLVADVAEHLGVRAPTRIVSRGLLAKLPRFITGVEREALAFIAEDSYDTASAQEHAGAVGLTMPDVGTALERWATSLVATRFTKDAAAPPAEFIEVAGSKSFVVGDVATASSLYLHGLPWDSDSWRELIDAMEASGAQGELGARADLPGLGRSSATTASDVQWLSALLESRREPVQLVAHSWSTGVALRCALMHPERVRGLVLISPYFLQARAPWFLRFAPLATRLLRSGDAATLQRRLLGSDGPLRSSVVNAHGNLRRRGVARQTARRLATASRKDHRAQLRQALRDVTVPITVMHGENDPLLHGFKDAVAIAGAGHNPHVSHPAEVASQLMRDRVTADQSKELDQDFGQKVLRRSL